MQPPADPPAPSGNLQAELDAFTTIDACVDARARLDPLVGDALEAIGYGTFLRDACRILEAAKARDPKRCETIDASALRERCQATVAQVAADADACPWAAPERPQLGRDPACVAIASRDVRLCAGVAQPSAKATCEAVISHDEARCLQLAARSDAAWCRREANRWRAATAAGPSKPEERAIPEATGTLRIEGIDAGAPMDVGLGPDVRYGVVVTEDRSGAHFVLGPLSDSGLDFVVPSPHVRTTLALRILVPTSAPAPDGPREARIERAELSVAGRPPLATPVARSTLRAKVSHFDLRRGEPLEIAIDGTLSDGAGAWNVHAQATTFIRDVVRDPTQVLAGRPAPPEPAPYHPDLQEQPAHDDAGPSPPEPSSRGTP